MTPTTTTTKIRTTVRVPGNWPAFKPDEVLRIKNAPGFPGLWRTYENFVPANRPKANSPQVYRADVELRPAPLTTNKPAPSEHKIVRMGGFSNFRGEHPTKKAA